MDLGLLTAGSTEIFGELSGHKRRQIDSREKSRKIPKESAVDIKDMGRVDDGPRPSSAGNGVRYGEISPDTYDGSVMSYEVYRGRHREQCNRHDI